MIFYVHIWFLTMNYPYDNYSNLLDTNQMQTYKLTMKTNAYLVA